MSPLRIRVERIDVLTPAIRRLHLVAADGGPLPGFTAGAHIGVHVPLSPRSQRRAYSLVNAGGRADSIDRYEIAVLHAAAGSGGSQWMHACAPGDEFDIDPPRNDFPLVAHARRHLLVAGGIGITPILAMARELASSGRPFTLHYAARDAVSMAYRDEVAALPGATCWFDDGEPSRGLPLADAIGAPERGTHLYVCGPAGLIEATLAAARHLGWRDDALHCERFAAPVATAENATVEVRLAGSGHVLNVPPGTSILDAMIEAGLDPLYDCRRGDCGVCAVRLLDGDPDHRDICLSDDDHASGAFCPCVSRAHGAHLVLDL
ncbi:PDR/VanB family oxidoreductase [Burkholderia cenocepacia]|jgi:vanillate O-demethylase ferredoxin subunit|uniref:PDR/VanB family oxidoreductase n=1 Tax=Burkholderia cenocepacia TaxID=95486 RepID=UPI0022325A1D|nr:PDR/VanB family oxidoreductase [Burkholderia cenocepacia]MCW3657380.1 PDR/VanB family oxidoreductase [Burkholderia cenocepacia]MDS0805768.1 PDR/VanB family oxidoreductase [Burkholderia cenocepacia]HDR9877281.1 oxidoreductase [Burkholderia cenocepacia]HDR9884350.1 oxidoreductase [Burkholderia cenocepacia]